MSNKNDGNVYNGMDDERDKENKNTSGWGGGGQRSGMDGVVWWEVADEGRVRIGNG